jgi:hypothetical protein
MLSCWPNGKAPDYDREFSIAGSSNKNLLYYCRKNVHRSTVVEKMPIFTLVYGVGKVILLPRLFKIPNHSTCFLG